MQPANSAPLAYLNGLFPPQSEARLPLHDAGFVFGATVSDLCRTFRHRLFRLTDHLHRFRQSCQLASIPQALPDEKLLDLAQQLLRHNTALLRPDEDLALVMFATPGEIGYFGGMPGGAGEGKPTLGMHTFPLPFSRYRRHFREGVRLLVPKTRHVPEVCIDPHIKMRSRLSWWLAEQEVHNQDPAATALLLNQAGDVTETAAANFLWVSKGNVISSPRSNILGGISLLTVEELCHELKIPFLERLFTIQDAMAAEEAMLSSTPYCLAGVRSIEGKDLPWPGPIFCRLADAWTRRVGVDFRAQILAER